MGVTGTVVMWCTCPSPAVTSEQHSCGALPRAVRAGWAQAFWLELTVRGRLWGQVPVAMGALCLEQHNKEERWTKCWSNYVKCWSKRTAT